MFASLTRGFTRSLEVCIALCLASMAVLVFGNVVLRYGFNSGITFSEEISRLLFVWLTFLGTILASREHAHLGVDSLVKRLPHAARQACILVSGVLMILMCGLLFWGSWKQAAGEKAAGFNDILNNGFVSYCVELTESSRPRLGSATSPCRSTACG